MLDMDMPVKRQRYLLSQEQRLFTSSMLFKVFQVSDIGLV